MVAQAVLCDFITEGHFGRHLRRMREVYAERLGVLLTAARSEWGDRLTLQSTNTGLQTVAWLSKGLGDVEFAPRRQWTRRRSGGIVGVCLELESS